MNLIKTTILFRINKIINYSKSNKEVSCVRIRIKKRTKVSIPAKTIENRSFQYLQQHHNYRKEINDSNTANSTKNNINLRKRIQPAIVWKLF